MGVIEYIAGADAWVLTFPVTFHPKGGLEILAGPGVELEPRRGGSDENGESEDDDETDGEEESGRDALFLFRIGVAYSFEFGERYSITPGLELDFVNEEDDHNVIKPPIYPSSFGWAKDGVSVLLYDNWDVWNIPVHGGEGVNLTLNGKQEKIR